jgi:precorrin-2 dehydrogenase/sirohydrochlorin ferrochelatase
VRKLLKFGAKVTVISPEISSGMRRLEEKITILERKYRRGDVQSFLLVFAATGIPSVNSFIAEEGKREEILVNVVDTPDKCSFILPAVMNRGDLTIAVSTNGQSPSLAKKIRDEIEEIYKDKYVKFLKLLSSLRPKVANLYPENPKKRKFIWDRLMKSDIMELLACGREKDAREKAEKIVGQ